RVRVVARHGRAYAVELVGVRTHAGTELLAWEGGPAGLVPRDAVVLRVGGKPLHVVALDDGAQFTEPPVLLQQPRGTLLLYYSTTSGVFRTRSGDDGRSWSAPRATPPPERASGRPDRRRPVRRSPRPRDAPPPAARGRRRAPTLGNARRRAGRLARLGRAATPRSARWDLVAVDVRPGVPCCPLD